MICAGKTRLWLPGVTLLALGVALVQGTPAQNPLGALRGTVYDSSGAVIPGASITLRESAAAVARNAKSDERGQFLL